MRLETEWYWYAKTKHGYDAYCVLANASGGGHVDRKEWRLLKSGKRSTKSMTHISYAHFTPLMQCDNCEKVSTPKNIQARSFGTIGRVKKGEAFGKWYFAGDLCMSCFNKLRPAYQRYTDIYETQRLLNKLKRTICDVNKNQNHRAIKRISCQHDNGCKER